MAAEYPMATVRKDDLDVLLVACLKYLPDPPHPDIPPAFGRLDDARRGTPEVIETDPLFIAEEPPGRYGRIEMPGYRENEGWISEETRFGLQVAVVRDREGTETAAIGIGPLCRVVWLPVPELRPEPRVALPAGTGYDDGPDDDEDLDDEDDGLF